jgi:threonine/homoserine/homoserine lactone efflux protein
VNSDLFGFAVMSVVLSVTPGPDTMLVLSNTMAGGTKQGIATTLGVKAGTITHSLLAAVGVAAILMKFAAFYTVMKAVGAAYLIALGVLTVVKALSNGRANGAPGPGAQVKNGLRCFTEGYLSNILNPKVVVFYVAVLPQFVGPGDPVFITTAKLASIHIGVSFLWLVSVSFFVGTARKWLTRPEVRRAIGAVSGLAIAGFGLKLALSRS